MQVPLVVGDAPVGVLQFYQNTPGRPYTRQDLETVRDLSRRISLAMEHVRVVREAREMFADELTGRLIAGASGTFISCNAAFRRLMRLHENAPVDVERIFGGPQTWREFMYELERGGPINKRDLVLYDSRGQVVHVLATAMPVVDENGSVSRIRLHISDLTGYRQLESQLRQAQKMEAVGRLAGGIAHDFNNLLMVIRGQAERTLQDVAADSAVRRSLETINDAADRAAAVTRQLLAFSRQQVLSPQVLNLNQTVGDLQQIIMRLIGEDVTVSFRLQPDLAAVRADPSQIEQVLLNLAINARDAMPNGGALTIATSNATLDEAYVRQHVPAAPGEYVRITISDTGVGMDRDTLARIFEPFFTTKPLGKGTGLGLSTAYGIVKQSGGYIWAYSELNLGTTFKIYLPAVAAVKDEPAAPRAKVTPKRVAGTETILLAEDEEGVRELLEEVLGRNGYTVLTASSGAEAVQISEFYEGEVHLLVTDVVMPGMSGPDVASRLRARRPGIRVVFLSGYTDDALAAKGGLAAGEHFLQKPFSASELVQLIRQALTTPV
jgi:signal transduction histidine kinase/CheY-like chemotaxis protein